MRNNSVSSARSLSHRALVIAMLLLAARICFGHPMGNFSISHYAEIALRPDGVDLRYIVDMAEIPTFQEMHQYGVTATQNDPKLRDYLRARANELARGLNLSVNESRVWLSAVSEQAIFPAGAGGLPTMKLGILYRVKLPLGCDTQICRLEYQDTNFAPRAGWKEIVVRAGPDVAIKSTTAPDRDRSAQLTNYPTDLVNSPPQVLTAEVAYTTGISGGSSVRSALLPVPVKVPQRNRSRRDSPFARAADLATHAVPAQPAADEKFAITANAQKTPRSAFTQLIAAPKISLGIALFAALIAAGLGGLHALEPGHGKTIVAAYLVGTKGTARHALLLGATVTVTHTAGVYLLGGVTLYAQKYIMPDRLYPFLGVLSGLLIVGMGLYLLLQRLAGADALHSHANGEGAHRHFGFTHTHAPAVSYAVNAGGPNQTKVKKAPLRQLLVLGITGGIVPCPAALVVLLSALALHRVAFGMVLIVAFSTGLAAVLIGMGMIAVYAGRLMTRVHTESAIIHRWLPVTSAAMITLLGCAIAVRSLVAAGILPTHV